MTLKIIPRKPLELRGYERNARTHDEAQINQIVASIREFGFNNPILVDETDTIIAGHGRLAAALRMGLEQVPCIVLAHLSEVQRRAYILADNKIALNAGWDAGLLSLELADLQGDLDLSVLGFSAGELAELMPLEPGEGLTDPDQVPDGPAEPRVQLGDIWNLGNHRLLCGDCTDSASWLALLAGELLSMVWTDPPYNVNYGDKAKFVSRKDKAHRNTDKILNDHLSARDFRCFLERSFAALFTSSRSGAPVYVAHSETERETFTGSFLGAGFKLSSNLIWKKSSLVLGRSDYQYIHEPILYGWKPGAAHPWYGGRKQTTVLEALEPIFGHIQQADGGGVHGA